MILYFILCYTIYNIYIYVYCACERINLCVYIYYIIVCGPAAGDRASALNRSTADSKALSPNVFQKKANTQSTQQITPLPAEEHAQRHPKVQARVQTQKRGCANTFWSLAL